MFLLLRAYKFWDFPKEIVKRGEDPFQATCQEVKEEAGIKDLKFSWGKSFIETEPSNQGKIARYYLAETSEETLTLPISQELGQPEHHEYRWLTFEEPQKLLVPRVQKILNWVRALIKYESLLALDHL